MDRNDDVRGKLLEMISEVLREKGTLPPQIDDGDTLMGKLGLDSLDLAVLVVRLEQEFGHDPFRTGRPLVLSFGELVAIYEKESLVIAHEFRNLAEANPSAAAIVAPTRDWTYGDLAELADRYRAGLAHAAGKIVGLAGQQLPQRVAQLVALDEVGAGARLFPGNADAEFIQRFQWELDLGGVLNDDPPQETPPEAIAEPHDSRRDVVLFTSGTSGPPKPVTHDWASLAAAVHRGARVRGRRWLLTYDPTSFAGIQVWLQAILTGGAVCLPESPAPVDVAKVIVAGRVEFATGTPTMFRMLLGAVQPAELAGAALEQITLGGEAVSQGILDALRAVFPRARIAHIYASTEWGVCFSVRDGLAGFPVSYLNETATAGARPLRPLRVSPDGELEIYASSRAARAADPDSAAPPAWQPTGDLVEQRGDRIHFLGRKSGTINVGGSKVYPEAVEAVLQGVPGVAEVRVGPMASSLVGQLVRAQVVAAEGVDVDALRATILQTCRAQLARHQIPAAIEFLSELPRTAGGKLSRTAE